MFESSRILPLEEEDDSILFRLQISMYNALSMHIL